MIPTNFDEQNMVYNKPENWTEDQQCLDLPVLSYVDQNAQFHIVSCWQPTEQEKADIAAGKPIWLDIHGDYQPPVCLCTEKPFKDVKPLNHG